MSRAWSRHHLGVRIWKAIFSGPPTRTYRDLSVDHYESTITRKRRQHQLTRQLEALTGQKVILQPRPDHPAA
jgi:hypothetical protein